MSLNLRPKVPSWPKVEPPRAVKQRRSHGQRLRLRKSLIMPSIWKRPASKECSRKFPRFSALPELSSAKSSRSVDPLPVHLSRSSRRENFFCQSDNSITLLVSTKEPKPYQQHRSLRMRPRMPWKEERRSDLMFDLVDYSGKYMSIKFWAYWKLGTITPITRLTRDRSLSNAHVIPRPVDGTFNSRLPMKSSKLYIFDAKSNWRP